MNTEIYMPLNYVATKRYWGLSESVTCEPRLLCTTADCLRSYGSTLTPAKAPKPLQWAEAAHEHDVLTRSLFHCQTQL